MKIAICPGHYKEKKGATNKKHKLNEHDEAKLIAFNAADFLKNAGHEVEIIIGKLVEKVARINAGDFDLALDLHFNADADHLDPNDLDDSRGHGCMVMYCPQAKVYGDDEPNGLRRQQAYLMSEGMSRTVGNRNLGGRAGWYWGSNPPEKKDYFLRKTNCAAFIPEFGYIDNNGFAEAWLVSGYHKGLSEALVNGIQAAFPSAEV